VISVPQSIPNTRIASQVYRRKHWFDCGARKCDIRADPYVTVVLDSPQQTFIFAQLGDHNLSQYFQQEHSTMTIESIRGNVAGWLSQGISPQRLAITLALGFAIGCLPLIGISTLLCAGLALALGLNQPVIQAANYAAMPVQLVLIVPFVRLGGWIFSNPSRATLTPGAWLHLSGTNLAAQSGVLVGHALTGWLLIAVPAVLILFTPLSLVLQRIPALAAAEAGD
jgi:hypothetical protein